MELDNDLMSNYIESMSQTDNILALISEIREKSNRLIAEEMQKHDMEGLAPSHGAILIQLYNSSKLCMKDLADGIKKDKSTITALVNKLVKLGYVERVKGVEDNRITYLRLTGKGRRTEGSFFEISDKVLSRIYRNFEIGEREELSAMLEKMSENL
jgi:DNA-binding MarR family transcriptional regulator